MSLVAADIETAQDDSAVMHYKPIKPDGRLKDMAKIAAHEAEARAEQGQNSPLDRWAARIVALAMQDMTSGERIVRLCKTAKEEAAALREFWWFTDNKTVVGHNFRAFDYPTIVTRSWLLGVPFHASLGMPHRIRTGKHIVDTFEWATFGNGIREAQGSVISRGLVSMCKRFGIDVPDGDIDGASIGEAVRAGQWDAVKAHVVADLDRTIALATKMNVVSVLEESVTQDTVDTF
jgi:hypothetical protein